MARDVMVEYYKPTPSVRQMNGACNLRSYLWRLALPRYVHRRSLTTLREELIKIRAKVVRHAKYVTFQMAEVAVQRELFATILGRIQRFGVTPPLVQRG